MKWFVLLLATGLMAGSALAQPFLVPLSPQRQTHPPPPPPPSPVPVAPPQADMARPAASPPPDTSGGRQDTPQRSPASPLAGGAPQAPHTSAAAR